MLCAKCCITCFVCDDGKSRCQLHHGQWFSEFASLGVRKKITRSCIWEYYKYLRMTWEAFIKMKTHQARPAKWEQGDHGLWIGEIRVIRGEEGVHNVPNQWGTWSERKKWRVACVWIVGTVCKVAQSEYEGQRGLKTLRGHRKDSQV